MKMKKTLLMTALSLMLVAPTVLEAFNTEAQVTVNAAKKHKAKKHTKVKHHKKVKKTKKAKKAKKNNSTTPVNTTPSSTQNQNTTPSTTTTANNNTQPATTPVNNDQTAFNNAVSSLGIYANPGAQNSYTVGAGTRFNNGNYTDYRDSLNAITSDMGSTDAYDNTNFGNKAVMVFQQQASELAQAFKGRFSTYDNQVISDAASKVQQNWANGSTTASARDQQWNNIVNLLNGLSGGFSKLS